MTYIVAVDSSAFYSGLQQAKLYKVSDYRNRATLAATGTVSQMQELADVLNAEKLGETE